MNKPTYKDLERQIEVLKNEKFQHLRSFEAIKLKEKKYATLFNCIADPIVIFDQATYRFIDCNQAAIDRYGYTREEFLTMKPHQLHPPEDLEKVDKNIDDKNDTSANCYTHITKNGEFIPVEIHTHEIEIENTRAWISIIRDITKRKEAEDSLSESKQRLSLLIQQTPMGVIECSPDFKVNEWNIAAENIFGYSKEEAKGRDIAELIVPESEKKPIGKIWKILLNNKSSSQSSNENITKDGRIILCEWYNTPLVDQDNNVVGVASLVRDITEGRQAEEDKKILETQLYQAQKMESIGRLAGGIAHDFNNILVGIMGFAEMLKMKHQDLSTFEGKAASTILSSAERAADLTNQILGFARGGKYNPVILNINESIKNTIEVTEKIFEKNIRIQFDFEENIKPIEADQNQIRQVFNNLFINAKEAMPEGGILTLKTENTDFDSKYAKNHPDISTGKYIKISVADSGKGMTKEICDRIFEPFFSTKSVGKSSGLGLATVYGIIKNHNGHIDVSSTPGSGSIFTILFPVSDKTIKKADIETEIIKGDGATILIVDDEDVVRNFSENMLRSLGYKTLSAPNGKKGLEIYKKQKDKIDLVILDLIMPVMAGKETYMKLKKISPTIKVILASGYSKDEKATEILRQGAMGFIQKPFRILELSKIVNNILHKD